MRLDHTVYGEIFSYFGDSNNIDAIYYCDKSLQKLRLVCKKIKSSADDVLGRAYLKAFQPFLPPAVRSLPERGGLDPRVVGDLFRVTAKIYPTYHEKSLRESSCNGLMSPMLLKHNVDFNLDLALSMLFSKITEQIDDKQLLPKLSDYRISVKAEIIREWMKVNPESLAQIKSLDLSQFKFDMLSPEIEMLTNLAELALPKKLSRGSRRPALPWTIAERSKLGNLSITYKNKPRSNYHGGLSYGSLSHGSLSHRQ